MTDSVSDLAASTAEQIAAAQRKRARGYAVDLLRFASVVAGAGLLIRTGASVQVVPAVDDDHVNSSIRLKLSPTADPAPAGHAALVLADNAAPGLRASLKAAGKSLAASLPVPAFKAAVLTAPEVHFAEPSARSSHVPASTLQASASLATSDGKGLPHADATNAHVPDVASPVVSTVGAEAPAAAAPVPTFAAVPALAANPGSGAPMAQSRPTAVPAAVSAPAAPLATVEPVQAQAPEVRIVAVQPTSAARGARALVPAVTDVQGVMRRPASAWGYAEASPPAVLLVAAKVPAADQASVTNPSPVAAPSRVTAISGQPTQTAQLGTSAQKSGLAKLVSLPQATPSVQKPAAAPLAPAEKSAMTKSEATALPAPQFTPEKPEQSPQGALRQLAMMATAESKDVAASQSALETASGIGGSDYLPQNNVAPQPVSHKALADLAAMAARVKPLNAGATVAYAQAAAQRSSILDRMPSPAF